MATLKEFEEALREQGMQGALAILEALRKRDRQQRATAPARRITAQKMTPELARAVQNLHATTSMTQQEIAFKLGVNQGRVNEVIKHGKWLSGDDGAPEARARDRAKARIEAAKRLLGPRPAPSAARPRPERSGTRGAVPPSRRRPATPQLDFGDL